MNIRLVTSLLALGLIASAGAQDAAEEQPLMDVAAFLQTQQEISAQARDGKFGFLKLSEVRALEKAQSKLREHLAGVASIDELSDQDKVAVFNAQQTVNAIISRDRSEEVRCERRPRTGSRFSETRCYTAEQLAEQRKAAERLQRSALSIPCSGNDGGMVCGQNRVTSRRRDR